MNEWDMDECALYVHQDMFAGTLARGDAAGLRTPAASLDFLSSCKVHIYVQPSIGVGDVLDDNGVLWRWQPRAHALRCRLLAIGSSGRIEGVARSPQLAKLETPRKQRNVPNTRHFKS